MIPPLNVSREDFPCSQMRSEGMELLTVPSDNHDAVYHPDIEYIDRGGMPLYIQLVTPCGIAKAPLIVYITGSAFRWQNVKGTLPYVCLLANRGFAVASVQYRGSEAAPFPAQMLDAKAAVRFMKLNADRFGCDAENVFLMGDSSGGHTALMAGLTAGISQFEEDICSEAASDVRGIIDLYGPTDITKMNDEPSVQDHIGPDSPEGCLIGRLNVLEHPGLTAPTVVMNYIDEERDVPPVLIFHGTNDETVPFGQSCMLHDRLRECGKEVSFYAVSGAHHGGREFRSNAVLDLIERFIRSNISHTE